MPMIPEAVIAMLACARTGAVHSVVFGGFAGAELAKRIDDATPTLVLSASCGIEPGRVVEYKPLLDTGIDLAEHKVEGRDLQRDTQRCELVSGRDIDWNEALAAAEPADCVPVAATDPLYILYPAPPANPRAWSATTAATPWPCTTPRGRSTACRRTTCSGPPPTSAGWSATPISSTRCCCWAAPR